MAMRKKIILAFIFVIAVTCLFYILLSEKPGVTKSQEPKLPYPYHSEEVTFRNSHYGITLSGTLTFPKEAGSFPAVILITGSGPQDRNEEILGHKPFLVIADYLTRHGFAVLRYDDRGIARSTGNFMTATSLDFASDAESAIAYLKSRKEINPEKIGLAGHSEGGLIAAIAASRSKEIGFVVSLAAPGAIGIDVMNLQAELIARAGGVDEVEIARFNQLNREITNIVLKSANTTVLRSNLTAYTKAHLQDYPKQMLPPGQTKEAFFKSQIDVMCTPWYQFLFKVNPALYFGKITCPVLALNGGKDLQVDAKQNLPAILKAVRDGGNSNVTIKELPNLNHLFQESKTGHPNEYAGIQETFSPLALTVLSEWMTAQTK